MAGTDRLVAQRRSGKADLLALVAVAGAAPVQPGPQHVGSGREVERRPAGAERRGVVVDVEVAGHGAGAGGPHLGTVGRATGRRRRAGHDGVAHQHDVAGVRGLEANGEVTGGSTGRSVTDEQHEFAQEHHRRDHPQTATAAQSPATLLAPADVPGLRGRCPTHSADKCTARDRTAARRENCSAFLSIGWRRASPGSERSDVLRPCSRAFRRFDLSPLSPACLADELLG